MMEMPRSDKNANEEKENKLTTKKGARPGKEGKNEDRHRQEERREGKRKLR